MSNKSLLFFGLFTLTFASGISRAEALELEFLSPSSCASTETSICERFKNKIVEWGLEEQSLVRSLFPADQLGLFKTFRLQLEASGVTKLVLGRSVTNAKNDERGLIGEAHYRPNEAFILIHSNFFKTKKVFSNGVSESTHALIHEMVHLYNQARGVGEDPMTPYLKSLATAIGWDTPRGRYPHIDSSELTAARDLYWTLYNQGQTAEALKVEEDYSLEHGFPSFYSIGNGTSEFLAEVISHLIHQNENQKHFSPELKHWLAMNGFSDYVSDDEAASAKAAYINESQQAGGVTLQHVGVVYLDGKALCTASLIKHGLVVTARHCFSEIEPFIRKSAMIPGLTIKFPYATKKTVLVGLNYKRIILDSEENDLAFLEYDPIKTSDSVEVPKIAIASTSDQNEELILASYRIPLKTRPLKLQSQSCELTGQNGSIRSVLPNYRGVLIGTDCSGYFLSSGAPFYSKRPDGSLMLVGILAHTFAIDKKGGLIRSKMKMDSWGTYSDTNFTPLANSEYLKSQRLENLSLNQKVLLQAVEQKLREYMVMSDQGIPEAISAKVQLQVKINIAKAMGVASNLIYDYVELALRTEQPPLLEDEQVFSSESLSEADQKRTLEVLFSIL